MYRLPQFMCVLCFFISAVLGTSAQVIVHEPGFTVSVLANSLPITSALTVDPDTGDIYITDRNTRGILRVVRGNQTLQTVTGDFMPGNGFFPWIATDIHFYQGKIYVVSSSGELVEVDAQTGQSRVLHQFSGIGVESGLDVIDDIVYITDGRGFANRLFTYNLQNGVAGSSVPLPPEAWGLEAGPLSKNLYIGHLSFRFFLMDRATNNVSLLSSVPSGNGNFVVGPNEQRLFARVGSEIRSVNIQNGASAIFLSGLTNDSVNDLALAPSSSGFGSSIYLKDSNKIYEISGFDALPGGNTAPEANAITTATNEDTAASIPLLATDADGDSLTFALDTPPTNGSVTITDATAVYTPNPNFNGMDSFTFIANDGTEDSAPAPVSITVNSINDAPVADPTSATTDEDVPAAIPLTGFDVDGDILTFAIDTFPQNGTLSISGSTANYTPNANFNGMDSFTFVANDGTEDSAPAPVSITVNPINDSPAADPTSATTDEDVPAAIPLTGFDVDGDILTFAIDTFPQNGTLSISGSTANYTPNPNFIGMDGFTFMVHDGTVNSAPAAVDITVQPVNDSPVAQADEAETDEETAVGINVLGNDSDIDEGDDVNLGPLDTTATLGSVSIQRRQLAVISDQGTSTWDPLFSSVFNPWYAMNQITPIFEPDSTDWINPTPASVGVHPWSTAFNASWIYVRSSMQSVSRPGGTDGQNWTKYEKRFTIPGDVASAVFSWAGDNYTYVYINGTLINPDIGVAPVNLNNSFDNVIVNNVDINAYLLSGQENLFTFVLFDGNGLGALKFRADIEYDEVVYDPNGQFEFLAVGEQATDTFGYTIDDGSGGMDTAAVTVTITGVNDAPVATPDIAATDEDSSVAIAAIDLLSNDSDVDANDVLSVVSVDGSGSIGAVALDGNGNAVYNPNGQFEHLAVGESASDTFTYTISDGHGGSDTAAVTVTITGVNDAPAANADTGTVEEDSAITVAVLDNDTDVDASDTHTVSAIDTASTIGSVSIDANGQTVSYDTNGQFESLAVGDTATDAFSYTIDDGNGGTDTATVTITITGVNDAPVAQCQDITLILGDDGTVELDAASVNAGSSDIDNGDTLNFTLSQYVFDCDDIGNQTVIFTATDQHGASANCEFTVTIQTPLDVTATLIEDGLAVPYAGAEVRVFDNSPLSCADLTDGQAGNGALSAFFADIYFGCPMVTVGTTDADGLLTLGVLPGDYLVITAIDANANGQIDLDDTFIGSHEFSVACGDNRQVALNECGFVLYGFEAVHQKQGSIVVGSAGVRDAVSEFSIDVNAELLIGPGAALIGDAFGDSVRLKNAADVSGNIFFNESDLHRQSNVAGNAITPLLLPLANPSPLFPAFSAGSTDVTVQRGETTTLPPGGYANVQVGGNGDADNDEPSTVTVLQLLGGVYSLQSLQLGAHTRLECLAPTEIRIKDRLDAGSKVFIGAASGSGLTAGDIVIFVEGQDLPASEEDGDDEESFASAASFGPHGQVRVTVVASNGSVKIGTKAVARGVFVGKNVIVQPFASVTLECGNTVFIPSPVPSGAEADDEDDDKNRSSQSVDEEEGNEDDEEQEDDDSRRGGKPNAPGKGR